MSFENIRGVERWAEELNKLVDQARQADDSPKRRELSETLTDFIVASHPENSDERAKISQLDDLAASVSEGILIDDSQQRLRAIASRANELAKFKKVLVDESTRNLASARSIRLDNLRAGIGVATDLVESLNKVKSDLAESEEGENAGTKIDKAIKSVQDARAVMEGLGTMFG